MKTAADRLVAELRPYVRDERVLTAIHDVPRDKFVAPAQADEAWSNAALPIGSGQTISQPLVVARMCELLQLRGGERILDIGTGSGYHAAILGKLGAHVWSVERHAALSEQALENLIAAEIHNVTLIVGDGTRGLPETAPFDAINVAAAAAFVPPALEEQLGRGARLVLPVDEGEQRLVVIERTPRGLERTALERVRFVPLVS